MDTSEPDDLVLLDDEAAAATGSLVAGGEAAPDGDPWLVAVIDDDPEVHELTAMALRSFRYQGRPVRVFSAHSIGEARALLAATPDLAVVLLDMVMETEQAGLVIAGFLREDLGNTAIRIVLRTGHPDQEPDWQVIAHYDINDYKSKVELTESRLFATMVTSLRSYSQIRALDRSRDELRRANETLEERVRARTRELYESEKRLRSILDASVFPILIVRLADDSVMFANASTVEMFGTLPTGRGGVFGPERFKPPTAHGALWQVLRAEGRVADMELRMIGNDGRPFWALLSAILMTYEGERSALISCNDITARKALEDNLKHLATTDSLTGTNNRRHFLETGQMEVQRARRFGHRMSVLMLDIDHFKLINDTYGHATGDEVICDLVATCADSLRDVDLMGRLGGEEFAVLLPETGIAQAGGVAERIRAAMEARVVCAKGTEIRYTVSIGVVELVQDDADIHAVIDRADTALYEAKRTGRNRVVVG